MEKTLEPEMITVAKAHYDQLVEDSDFLMRLEAYGVDNWQAYHDAYVDSEGIFNESE